VNLNTPSGLTNNLNQTAKFYTLETAGFFNDRLLIDYGWTRVINTQAVENDLVTPHTETTPQYYVYQNLRTYGGVVKIIPSVAVFYNNTFSLGTITAPNNNIPQPVGLNRSQELGVRGRWFENRLNARVSYFQATSTNNSVPSFPLNPAAPTVLIGGVVSHGFDGDANWTFNRNFTLLATFADYKAFAVAQPANVAVIQPGLVGPAYGINGSGFTPNASNTLPTQVPVDDVAEHTFSLFGRYTFTDPTLKGLDIALGVESECKRAITNNSNQVFFGYIPGRTLVNLFSDYKLGHFIFALNIDNLLDTKYIWSARSVNVIEPGTPINFKGTVTYNF
jgi:outer membrane receptor for ferric coprogen and ferric-rhodotorulic acid